jgi:hypothetical protein
MPGAGEPLTRKNFRLHQSKIDEAKRLLGASTETETIEQALDLVVFGERLLAGVDRMRGKRLVDIFAEEGD